MGPPTGPCAPDSHTSKRVCSDKDSKAVRKSGRDQHGTIAHSGSKRPAQHAEYHNAENKRRQEGAERAANVQKHATQLVQQLAAPGGQRTPKETSGTLAKAEDRQSTYNMSIDTKPWASGRDNVSHAISPTAGLPMQTGHYCDTDASSGQPTTAHAPLDTARDGSPVQQTISDPSDRAAQLQADSSEGNTEAGKGHSGAGSQLPPTSDHPKFSSTQKFKSDKESSPSMSAIKDRQIHEQTHQHHPQNRSESGKRYVWGFCL